MTTDEICAMIDEMKGRRPLIISKPQKAEYRQTVLEEYTE